MDTPEANKLAREVAEAVGKHPRFGGRGGQIQLAAALGKHTSTINGALKHPDTKMSADFIRLLAAALPDDFRWAADRLKAIEYPDATGPAPGADRARDAELVDEAITQVEAALEKLRAARRRI